MSLSDKDISDIVRGCICGTIPFVNSRRLYAQVLAVMANEFAPTEITLTLNRTHGQLWPAVTHSIRTMEPGADYLTSQICVDALESKCCNIDKDQLLAMRFEELLHSHGRAMLGQR